MMLGKVAPAPFSFTCAAAGPASVRAASAARRGDLIMSRCLVDLEVELRLEQGLRARRFLRRRRGSLIAHVVPVAQHPEVGADLVRDAADEPGLLVGRAPRLRM